MATMKREDAHNKKPEQGWLDAGPLPSRWSLPDFDPFSAGRTFKALGASLLTHPLLPLKKSFQTGTEQLKWLGQLLWKGEDAAQSFLATDRRFSAPEWSQHTRHAYLALSYMLWRKAAMELVEEAPNLDELTRAKARFFVEQTLDLMAPSNALLLNPQVLAELKRTRGRSLYKGLKNWWSDVKGGSGLPTQSGLGAFEVGRNIAVTPGKVIARSPLAEVIQYAPATDRVHAVPVLIIPPWINKYYILDLSPNNSYIRYMVEQGFTVFVISWKNPTAEMSETTFADYVEQGVQFAREAVEKVTGVPDPAAVAYCIGGTLLGVSQAYFKAKNLPTFRALTFFATMLDFRDPGEIKIMLDERALRHVERQLDKKGFLAGSEMASSFAYLRSRDLLWSYFVDNYLMGKEPKPFDILFWNSDFTRMPAAMHRWYLRNMYKENLLRTPGALKLNDVPLDLTSITEPVYKVAPEKDHIAPPHTTFLIHSITRAPIRFVLGHSGHIAGIVNPAAANKGFYFAKDSPAQAPTHMSLEEWKQGARKYNGSWWPDHVLWLREQCGEKVAPPAMGGDVLKPLCDAPGTYVMEK
jgi:polyhydroxyalkanoate synthase